MFPGTNVVYVSVGYAFARLQEMHCELNAGPVHYQECYCYHPHVTVAQKLDDKMAADVFRLAQERWEHYCGPRTFVAETFTFVQNTSSDRWRDLEQYVLSPAPAGSLY
jgi:2'-5' RNA ligase